MKQSARSTLVRSQGDLLQKGAPDLEAEIDVDLPNMCSLLVGSSDTSTSTAHLWPFCLYHEIPGYEQKRGWKAVFLLVDMGPSSAFLCILHNGDEEPTPIIFSHVNLRARNVLCP